MSARPSFRTEADDAIAIEEDDFPMGQRESYQYDHQELGQMRNRQQSDRMTIENQEEDYEEQETSEANLIALPELGVAELESKLFMLEKEVEKLRSQNDALLLDNERMQRELVEHQSSRGRNEDGIREAGKIEKRLEKMQRECKESEDRYVEMHQRYLDEQRAHQDGLSLMNEKHHQEIIALREEAESFRERLRACQSENERIIGSIKQEDGFKEDVQKHIDQVQDQFQYELQEQEALEKHLRFQLSESQNIIDDLEATVRQLEHEAQLSLDTQKQKERQHLAQLEELREKIEDRDYDLEELKQEVKNLKLQEIKSGSSIKQINDQVAFYKTQVIPGFEKNMKEFERRNRQKQEELKKQMGDMEIRYKVQIQQLKDSVKQSAGQRTMNGRLIENYGSPDTHLSKSRGLGIVMTEQSQDDNCSQFNQTPNNQNNKHFFGNKTQALGSLRDELGGERMTSDSRLYGGAYTSYNQQQYLGARESTNEVMAFYQPQTPTDQMEEKKFIFSNELARVSIPDNLQLRISNQPRKTLPQQEYPAEEDPRIKLYEGKLQQFYHVSQSALNELKYLKQNVHSQKYYLQLIMAQQKEIEALQKSLSGNQQTIQMPVSQFKERQTNMRVTSNMPRKSMRLSTLIGKEPPAANS